MDLIAFNECVIDATGEYGDFEVEDNFFEMGGKNKTRQQLKGQANGYVLADGLLVGSKDKVPLYLLGFMI